MLAAERQNQILRQARDTGTVRTAELATQFEVTEETIRRDLEKLGHAGMLFRTHGGAIYTDISRQDLSLRDRESRQAPQKSAIARAATGLLEEGDTILLDASSTALALARVLPETLNLTVVTYALPVVERLVNRSDITLIQLGGRYDPVGKRFSGLLTENALSALHIDRFFFSGKGLDLDKGISEADEEQARLKRLVLRQAAWSCALIDDTKVSIRSRFYFAPLADLDAIVINPTANDLLADDLDRIPCPIHVSKKTTAA